jgi:hypothetical protein
VVPHVLSRLELYILHRVEQFLPQTAVPNRTTETRDEGVLLWLSGLDVFDPNSVPIHPSLYCATKVFSLIICTKILNGSGFSLQSHFLGLMCWFSSTA